MISLSEKHRARISAAAEDAYPFECCGLLAGRWVGGDLLLDRIVPATNMALTTPATNGAVGETRRDRFEVDPQCRFDLMSALEGSDQEIIGHYHSHPDHPALPSKTDLDCAFEPGFVWLIVAVNQGRATDIRAHLLEADGLDLKSRRFREIPLHTENRAPYPADPNSQDPS